MVTALSEQERSKLSEVASSAAGWALDQPTLESLRRTARNTDVLGDLAARILRELDEHGFCLIQNVPTRCDEELAAFLGLVSTVTTEGNGGELFFSVSPAPDTTESSDLSTTTASFPYHSDSTYLAHPHEMLGLGCVVNASEGGDSRLILATDVAAQVASKAGPETLRALADPVFPFFLRDAVVGYGVQLVPLLWCHGEQWRMRYRSDVLDALVPQHDLDERHRNALDVLRSVLDSPAGDSEIMIRLQPHDYLMIDNRRALHSRTALGAGARELRRSKGYFLRSDYRSIA